MKILFICAIGIGVLVGSTQVVVFLGTSVTSRYNALAVGCNMIPEDIRKADGSFTGRP